MITPCLRDIINDYKASMKLNRPGEIITDDSLENGKFS